MRSAAARSRRLIRSASSGAAAANFGATARITIAFCNSDDPKGMGWWAISCLRGALRGTYGGFRASRNFMGAENWSQGTIRACGEDARQARPREALRDVFSVWGKLLTRRRQGVSKVLPRVSEDRWGPNQPFRGGSQRLRFVRCGEPRGLGRRGAGPWDYPLRPNIILSSRPASCSGPAAYGTSGADAVTAGVERDPDCYGLAAPKEPVVLQLLPPGSPARP